ncbi:MAG: hypothetical protein WC301_03015 [Candidatus Omnitrophota bacterium]
MKNKGNLIQAKVTLRGKVGLILLGVFLCVVFLEVLLRLAGFVVMSIQEYNNWLSMKQKNTYRILCIGESTTQGQYPHFVEEILNDRNAEVNFLYSTKALWQLIPHLFYLY